MPRQRGGHGDLVLHVNISVPRKLSKQQRTLLTDFAESMGQKKSQSTLERVRDWLGG
jgi:DnaJ-class molecular chaperone